MSLILRHAAFSRPSGRWSRSDYVIYDGEHSVGRIFRADVGCTEKTPWMWMIEVHQRRGAGPHHGLAASRDDAMVAFKTSWTAGDHERAAAQCADDAPPDPQTNR